jgi:NAD(P)-dependent dehydrogenase (short-subunit alcohol dehydrogenase family)
MKEHGMRPAGTFIVTGASGGIGAAVTQAFLERGYHGVATSHSITRSGELAPSANLALVDGDIGDPKTATRITETAVSRFGAVDVLVNNAGIFFTKPFTEYTPEDFHALVSTNLAGFFYLSQRVVKQMLSQKTGGSIVTISASLADNPIAGVTAAVPMMTKGGLNTVTLHLAAEYARHGIRVNAVAPGVVDTPLHKDTPRDLMTTLSPMGRVSTAKEIADAVLYLTDAESVTGEVLHIDGGAHCGKW